MTAIVLGGCKLRLAIDVAAQCSVAICCMQMTRCHKVLNAHNTTMRSYTHTSAHIQAFWHFHACNELRCSGKTSYWTRCLEICISRTDIWQRYQHVRLWETMQNFICARKVFIFNKMQNSATSIVACNVRLLVFSISIYAHFLHNKMVEFNSSLIALVALDRRC